MWCYVGKATKIFFVVVAVLAVVGLILGFGFLRHGTRSRAHEGGGCDGDGCQPAIPVPIPATATTSAPPLLSPPTIPEAAAPPPNPPMSSNLAFNYRAG